MTKSVIRTAFLAALTDGASTAEATAIANRAGLGGDPEPVNADPHKMNMPELKDWLTEQGIEFDAGAKKADLQALIPAEDGDPEDGDEKGAE